MKEQISALFQSGSFVGGQWLSGDNTFAVYDKATGEKLADIADAGEAEMQTAIQAAKAAFESWSAMPAIERSKLLRNWFTLMTERSDELAELMTLEQGKPLADWMATFCLLIAPVSAFM